MVDGSVLRFSLRNMLGLGRYLEMDLTGNAGLANISYGDLEKVLKKLDSIKMFAVFYIS